MERSLRLSFGSDQEVVRTLWAIGALGVLIAAIAVAVIHSRWHVGDKLHYRGRDYLADDGSGCRSATELKVAGGLHKFGAAHSRRVFVDSAEVGGGADGIAATVLYVEKTSNCFTTYDLQGGP